MDLLQTICPRTGAEIYDYVSEFEAADIANEAIIEQAARDLGLLKRKTPIRRKQNFPRIWVIRPKADEEESQDTDEAQSDAWRSFWGEQCKSFN